MPQLAARQPLPSEPDDNSGYEGRRDLRGGGGGVGRGVEGRRGSQSEMLGHKAVRATHLLT